MKTKKIFLAALAGTLALIFAGVTVAYGENAGTIDSTVVITDRFFDAFYNLAKGNTAWQVYRVADGSVSVDGLKSKEEWSEAAPIHIAGEWQWNERHKSQPWLFEKGALDFLAVWRLLYDSQNLYISCEFRDDNHEAGSYTRESWLNNDCAEFTFINPSCILPTDGQQTNVTWKGMQVYRKFTENSGLRGRILTVSKFVNDTGNSFRFDTVYVNDVPEGASGLGGIECAARAFEAEKYKGRWFLEARVPLCNVVSGKILDSSLRGKIFKMNLKVYDDDSSAIASTKNPTIGLGLERYSKWWTFGNRSINGDPLPTFILAGTPNDTPLKPAPDLKNLYCGKTPGFYDSLMLVNTVAERSSPLLLSANAISVSPNPVLGGNVSVFFTPVSSIAKVSIYDAVGRVVAVREIGKGIGAVKFNTASSGLDLQSGKYFVRFESADFRFTKSLLIVR